MTTYTVTFERVGRNHDVAPLIVDLSSPVEEHPDELAERVGRYALRWLGSRDVQVFTDLNKGTGFIACGAHLGGRFTIAGGAP